MAVGPTAEVLPGSSGEGCPNSRDEHRLEALDAVDVRLGSSVAHALANAVAVSLRDAMH